jgi:hypothetical protein
MNRDQADNIRANGRHDPHQQAEDMTAPTIKRNAAKKPLISGRRPDMTMPILGLLRSFHNVPDNAVHPRMLTRDFSRKVTQIATVPRQGVVEKTGGSVAKAIIIGR